MSLYSDAGRSDEALKLEEEALFLHRKKFGLDGGFTVDLMRNLTDSYTRAGRKDEALKLCEEALPLYRQEAGREHINTFWMMNSLAVRYTEVGRTNEALRLREEALEVCRKVQGGPSLAQDEQKLDWMRNFAASASGADRVAEAEQLYRELVPLRRRVHGNKSSETIQAIATLVNVLADRRRIDEGVVLVRELVALHREIHATNRSELNNSLRSDAELFVQFDRFAEADASYREILPYHQLRQAEQPAEFATVHRRLAECDFRQGRWVEAESAFRQVLKTRIATDPPPDYENAAPEVDLGRLLSEWAWTGRTTNAVVSRQRAGEGASLLRTAFASYQRATNTPAWLLGDVESCLGGALVAVAVTDPSLSPTTREARFLEAETFLLHGHQTLEQHADVQVRFQRDDLQRLIRLYEAWPKPDKLGEWQQKRTAFDREQAEKNRPARL